MTEIGFDKVPSSCGCGSGCGDPSTGPLSAGPRDWIPVEACTLPTADQPFRMAEFEDLLATSLVAHHRVNPQWLRLHLSGVADVETYARDLTAREAECCSFFDFDVRRQDGEVLVDVRVPDDKVMVLDGLAAQAQQATRTGMNK